MSLYLCDRKRACKASCGKNCIHTTEREHAVGVKLYRKVPVIVEAWQTDREIPIDTLEGVMLAKPGDYIITGVNGEQYPCKPDVFVKTYENV